MENNGLNLENTEFKSYNFEFIDGNSVVQLDKSNLIRRFYAIIIDTIIVLVFIYVINFLIIKIYMEDLFSSQIYFILAVLSFSLFYQLYFYLSELFFKGKTIGKKICGIIVISDSDTRLSASQIFLRNFFRLTYLIPPFFIIPDLISVLIDKRQKRIGDFFAQTLIVTKKNIF